MAENKNQHYVPRVHLRPFTLHGEDTAINLINIDRLRAIKNAPVKNQCSRDYFYGKSETLESAINFVENLYGKTVNNLSQAQAEIDETVELTIRRFSYLQFLRTEAASRKSAEMTTAMVDVPGSDMPIPPPREAMKTAVQIAMLHFAKTMGIIDDLKVRIIKNLTEIPFITSDDPAVLTNRLHIQRPRGQHQSFGVKSAGAIFFLPLSPQLCAVSYDPAVYHTPHRAGWLPVANTTDINAINQQQILNCMSNIYFKEWADRDQLISQIQADIKLRPTSRHHVIHAALKYTDDRGSHYAIKAIQDIREEEEVLVHIINNHAKPSMWPSFIRFRTDARAYCNGTRAGLTRRWCIQEGYVPGAGYRSIRV